MNTRDRLRQLAASERRNQESIRAFLDAGKKPQKPRRLRGAKSPPGRFRLKP